MIYTHGKMITALNKINTFVFTQITLSSPNLPSVSLCVSMCYKNSQHIFSGKEL